MSEFPMTSSRPADGRHLPIIHLNGSGRSAHLSALQTVERRLVLAHQALSETGPNMRDYYPEPERWPIAMDEWNRRLSVIQGLLDDVRADFEALCKVG